VLDEWVEFVSTYLACESQSQSQSDSGSGLPARVGQEDPEETIARIRSNPDEIRYYTLAYLLSGTFKDCSVILRFPEREEGSEGGEGGKPTITAIDLDPKSITRLPKWAELDAEIVGAFAGRENLREVEKCVDAHASG